MAHTDDPDVVADAIIALIEANLAGLGVDNVMYGDHDKIPSGMCVTVSPGVLNTALEGVQSPGGRGRFRFNTVITVYNSRVGDEATQRKAVNVAATAVRDLLHQHPTLDGIVIHGFVTTWDPGYKFKVGTMFRATQMIHESNTKLPISP